MVYTNFGACSLRCRPDLKETGKQEAKRMRRDDPRVEAIRSNLLELLERLDGLDLHQAGAHLSMAIHCLEPGSFDCPAPPVAEPVR